MHVQQFVVGINSAQPERLIAFYRDVVGLTPNFDAVPGAFFAGSSDSFALIVEGHSEVKDVAAEPQRLLLNFLVEDIAVEQARLEAQGVAFVRSAYTEPGVGRFATYADPDGNYCQLVQLGG